jgi:anaerobic selenocysteine-containing dehydrogenase
MHMYHSWGTQNAWLRQITTQNRLFVHRETAARLGIEDDGWVLIESAHGRVKGQVRLVDGVNPNTVWTWNAIGKRRGAWALAPGAPETERGFLLNPVIPDQMPPDASGRRHAYADPVTGQAAWFDVRVRLTPCAAEHGAASILPPLEAPPGIEPPRGPLSFGAAFRRKREAAA